MKKLFVNLLCSMNPLGQCQSFCSVCEKTGIAFLPLPDFYRDNALKHGYNHFGKGETIALDTYSCSVCGASDRERLYALWIDKKIQDGIFKKGANLLHFAPEVALSKYLCGLLF